MWPKGRSSRIFVEGGKHLLEHVGVIRETTKAQTKFRGADKYLAPPGRKQATATEGFDVHISYL